MYENFVRSDDCQFWGQCWVGDPIYYRDPLPGHINAIGYVIWSQHIASKLKFLGWANNNTNLLRNNGTVEVLPGLDVQPTFDVDIAPVVPDVNPIDFLILFCFFLGVCHL